MLQYKDVSFEMLASAFPECLSPYMEFSQRLKIEGKDTRHPLPLYIVHPFSKRTRVTHLYSSVVQLCTGPTVSCRGGRWRESGGRRAWPCPRTWTTSPCPCLCPGRSERFWTGFDPTLWVSTLRRRHGCVKGLMVWGFLVFMLTLIGFNSIQRHPSAPGMGFHLVQ